MNYKLLHQLIDEMALYGDNNATISEFAEWLYRRHTPTPYSHIKNYDEAQTIPPQGDTRAQITQLLVLMYKYLKFYLKKYFEDKPLSSPDDFGFLASLFLENDMQKNELIAKNTMEFTSGMEIIKRLERTQLIEAFDDPNDRRAKRVRITGAGRGLIISMFPTMAEIGKLAMGDLTESEQTYLLSLLHRLNHFHNPIFHEEKNAALDTILDKYGHSI